MTDLLFLDTETVHIDPFAGSVWEVAWATLDQSLVTSVYVMPSLMRADPTALEVGRFFDRFHRDSATPGVEVEKMLVEALNGRPALAGSAPWFDAAHLVANWPDLAGRWHHHHVDVPTLLCGAGSDPEPPWRLSQAAELAGIDLDNYARHTAAGDVRLTRDLYRAWRDGQ